MKVNKNNEEFKSEFFQRIKKITVPPIGRKKEIFTEKVMEEFFQPVVEKEQERNTNVKFDFGWTPLIGQEIGGFIKPVDVTLFFCPKEKKKLSYRKSMERPQMSINESYRLKIGVKDYTCLQASAILRFVLLNESLELSNDSWLHIPFKMGDWYHSYIVIKNEEALFITCSCGAFEKQRYTPHIGFFENHYYLLTE